MTGKEFIDSALISLGIAGSASVVRSIFVPQEGSAWDKFLKFFGSVLFGAMVGILIRHTETGGYLLKYVDYIVAGATLAANEIVTTWVRRTVNVFIVFIETKFKTAESKKRKETKNE